MFLKRYVKNKLYFIVAWYFIFWATFKLKRWNPRVVIVTGSNGKTTTLNLIKSQLKGKARYSERANSVFGIPFDILNLKRTSFKISEWFIFFCLAPFKSFEKEPKEKIYVVEADCDRPKEGFILSRLLKPEVTIWLSAERTHSQNFDRLVSSGKFNNVDEAIAHEFAYFIFETSSLCILNGDDESIKKQTTKASANKIFIHEKDILEYKAEISGTTYKLKGLNIRLPHLQPKKIFYSILAVVELLKYFDLPLDNNFSDFETPPGRSSIFEGIKNTRIIDSSYNANYSSVSEIIQMFEKIKSSKKWIVLGDIIEQGKEEKTEHEKVATLLNKHRFEKVILIGPRLKEFTKPLVTKDCISFEYPREGLEYILKNLSGGETILFKGARFLEGIIEHLLENKKDIDKLCRRETVWVKRRKKWNL